MIVLACAVLSAFLVDGAPKPTHFTVTARFNPPRRKAPGEVAVQFVPADPEVKINETPAPRLKLVSGPATVAVPAGGAAPPHSGAAGPAGPGHYLDLTLPVTFPVTLAPGTPAGSHEAAGTVTYFYCSKREGWCRKGTADVAFTIAVP